MECIEAAFGKDMSLKSNPQVCFDDFNVVASSDDFCVDELLDFSHEDAFLEEEAEPEGEEIDDDDEEEENKDSSFSSVSASTQKHDETHENSNQTTSNSSAKDDFWSVSSRELEDLEWLSHFVADPLQEYSPPIPCFFSPEKNNTQKKIDPNFMEYSYLETPFPSKPRSKRPRICGKIWSLSTLFFSDMSSSSITSSSSCSSLSSPPAAKKAKRKPAVEGTGIAQSVRRCSHCGVQKTPQWRAGPMGSKTLCNACGVRFKSGRLFPEYRPACSPTFSTELHSNHHRKVLEMRRQKDFPGENNPVVAGF